MTASREASFRATGPCFPVVRKRPQGHVSSSPRYLHNGHWEVIRSLSSVSGRSKSVAAALQSRLNLRNHGVGGSFFENF